MATPTKIRSYLSISVHWIFGRMILMHMVCLLLLLSERAAREQHPPIASMLVYVMVGASIIISVQSKLPKSLIQAVFIITFVIHLFYGIHILVADAWRYRPWIRIRSSLKSLLCGSVYLRLLAGNRPFTSSIASRLGVCLHIIAFSLQSVLCVPNAWRQFDRESQLHEWEANIEIVKFAWLQSFIGAIGVFSSLVMALPVLSSGVPQSQSRVLYKMYRETNSVALLIRTFQIISKEIKINYWLLNGVDYWLVIRWILDDVTFILGSLMIYLFHTTDITKTSGKEQKKNT